MALDAPVVAVGLVATLLTSLLIAGPVIWFHRQTSLAHGLQAESRSGTSGRAALRLRQAFIVAQVALAFLLLSGAGLLGLSLKKALSVPTGFQAGSVLTGQLSFPWKGYPTDEARGNFVQRLLPAVRALPGVTHVAFSTGLPFTGGVNNNAITVEGRTLAPGETLTAHYTSFASAEYWPAMGIPLLRGRLFNEADFESAQNVCVVDQAFADRYWPGGDPIGRRLAVGTDLTEDRASTIVGVVAPIKQSQLTEADGHGAVYFAPKRALIIPNSFTLVVRSGLPPESLAASVRKAVLALDPGLPVENLRPMQTLVDESLTARRSPAILAGIFAGTALLLASIGLYGVMAYAVTQRTREFGIRLALGAAARDVLRLVIREGARLALLGLALGLAVSLLLTRSMSSVLYGVEAHDPFIHLTVTTVLAFVALTACFLPARRATKVDPMIALRAE